MRFLLILFWFQNHPFVFSPIHFYNHWMHESDMANKGRFVLGRLCIQIIGIERAIALKGVNGEISYPKRSQILKKMRSLTRIDPITG